MNSTLRRLHWRDIELADVIALADLHAAVPKDRVGRGHMEEEIRQRELLEIDEPREPLRFATDRTHDLARFRAGDLVFRKGAYVLDGPVDSRRQVGESLFV